MADSNHTISLAARAKAIATDAVAGAKSHRENIVVLSEVLAIEMQKVHGGDWRTQIDPDCEFVMIARKGRVNQRGGRS